MEWPAIRRQIGQDPCPDLSDPTQKFAMVRRRKGIMSRRRIRLFFPTDIVAALDRGDAAGLELLNAWLTSQAVPLTQEDVQAGVVGAWQHMRAMSHEPRATDAAPVSISGINWSSIVQRAITDARSDVHRKDALYPILTEFELEKTDVVDVHVGGEQRLEVFEMLSSLVRVARRVLSRSQLRTILELIETGSNGHEAGEHGESRPEHAHRYRTRRRLDLALQRILEQSEHPKDAAAEVHAHTEHPIR